MGFIKITLSNEEEIDEARERNDMGVPALVNLEIRNLHQDEAIGMLMDAYMKIAQDLIGGHPKDCRNCPVYEFHSKILMNMQEVEREIKSRFSNHPSAPTPTKPTEMWEK